MGVNLKTWLPTRRAQAMYAPGTGIAAGSAGANFASSMSRLFLTGTTSFRLGLDYQRDFPDRWNFQKGGRFRLFALARLTPSGVLPLQLAGDVVDQGAAAGAPQIEPMASSGRVATLAPAVASGSPGAYGAQPSLGFTILDLGDIGIPGNPGASNAESDHTVRLWVKAATSGGPTAILDVLGAYLHRLDTPNGLMLRGLAQPSVNPVLQGRLHLRADDRIAHVYRTNTASADLGAASTNAYPVRSAGQHYLGGFPLLGASIEDMTIMAGIRSEGSGATSVLVNQANLTLGVSVVYRPRFAFLKGI
jgi:hypothetical protein